MIIALSGQAAGPEAQYLVLVTMILLTFAAATGPVLAAACVHKTASRNACRPDAAEPEGRNGYSLKSCTGYGGSVTRCLPPAGSGRMFATKRESLCRVGNAAIRN